MMRSRSSDSVYAPGDARTPGHSSSVTHAPPTISRRSKTSTDRPARARYAAATSPLWPAPTTTASGTRPFDLGAAIHHHDQSCLTRTRGSLLVDHAQLHPHSLRPDRDRFVHVSTGELRAAKDVDHVDRLADRRQVRMARLPKDLARARLRVHGDHALAARLKERGDRVRVAPRIGGAAHDRPGRELLQNPLRFCPTRMRLPAPSAPRACPRRTPRRSSRRTRAGRPGYARS